MKTTRNPAVALLLVALTIAAAAASAFVASSAALPSSPTDGRTGPYGWPVKPFDRAHPVRGNFGDPRTVFDGSRSQRTIESGSGMFQFHHGVDISAPDGSPVYAVASGRITRTHGDRVTVECGKGRAFQYWHITVSVRVGQHAVARKTVLGHILPKREHVHLTHLENGRPVNPLVPGRLTPYHDATSPTILSVTFHRTYALVEATDMPALPVPGRWSGFPVTPAVVTWRIENGRGRAVLGARVAWDVRYTIPGIDCFWGVYARGSHQNWPVFSDGKARGMTGRYVFRLSPRSLDTNSLPVGRYTLVVTARDTAGNTAVRSQGFSIDDR